MFSTPVPTLAPRKNAPQEAEPAVNDLGVPLGIEFDESDLGRKGIGRLHCAALPVLKKARGPAEILTAARLGWEERARSEYEGVAVAHRFHRLTVGLNAPMDLQELALRIALHEQQHARLCLRAAFSLGSDGRFASLPSAFTPEGGRPVSGTEFWELVCGAFAISEVIAFRLLRWSLRNLPESGYRGILARIQTDETLHCRLGFSILASFRGPERRNNPHWVEAPSDAWIRSTVRDHLSAASRRDVIDPVEAALFGRLRAAAALRRLGIPDPKGFLAVYTDAVEREVPRRFKAIGLEV